MAGIAGTDERDWRTWEWVTPLVTAVGICAIASIPYLLEYTACTPDMAPSSFTYNTWDQNLYLSWTVQGKWGRFFCEDQFTSEATPPILFSSFFWFLGTLARGLHLPPAVLYHAARVLGIFAFCIVLYPFCRAFSGTRKEAVLAHLLTCLSAGVGAVILVLFGKGGGSIDLWVTDAFPFLCMYLYPLHSWSLVFIVAIMLLAFRLLSETGNALHMAMISALLLALATFHQYHIASVAGAMGLYILLRALRDGKLNLRLAWRVLPPFVLPAFVIGYIWLGHFAHPVLRVILRQGLNTSPSFKYVLLGLGVPFALCVLYVGARILPHWRKAGDRDTFLVAWIVSSLVLMYAPVAVQLKFITGVYIPICILASGCVFEVLTPCVDLLLQGVAGFRPQRTGKVIAGVLLLATFPSNLYWIIRDSGNVLKVEPPLYVSRADAEAMDWIGAHARAGEAVLCSPLVGNFLPTRSKTKSFTGQWCWTANYYYKNQLVREFFLPTWTNAQRVEFMRRYGLRYVFWGRAERAWSGPDLRLDPPFQKVYSNDGVTLYSFPIPGLDGHG